MNMDFINDSNQKLQFVRYSHKSIFPYKYRLCKNEIIEVMATINVNKDKAKLNAFNVVTSKTFHLSTH